jgi:formyl-CoA transferase
LTGYGDDGPDANLPGIDIIMQARTGDIASRQEPGRPPPAHSRLYYFDMGTSMLAAYAITLALRDRERTGVGRKIEVSLLQTGVSLHAVQMTKVEGFDDRFATGAAPGFRQMYECADGRYILNMFINIGPRWDSLCRALQLDELVNDPRFDTAEHRAQHTDAIVEILSRHLLTKSSVEWEAIFKAAGHTTSIVNEMITQFEQPGLGEVKAVGLPFRMSPAGDADWLRRPVPHLGEHTDEVLRELGYSQAEVETLRAAGALGKGA